MAWSVDFFDEIFKVENTGYKNIHICEALVIFQILKYLFFYPYIFFYFKCFWSCTICINTAVVICLQVFSKTHGSTCRNLWMTQHLKIDTCSEISGTYPSYQVLSWLEKLISQTNQKGFFSFPIEHEKWRKNPTNSIIRVRLTLSFLIEMFFLLFKHVVLLFGIENKMLFNPHTNQILYLNT